MRAGVSARSLVQGHILRACRLPSASVQTPRLSVACRYSDGPRKALPGDYNSNGQSNYSTSKESEPETSHAPPGGSESKVWWGLLPLALGAAWASGAGGIMWESYLQSLASYPFPAKLATGVVGALAGDLLAQTCPNIVAKVRGQKVNKFVYDNMRGLRFMAFSALVGTPVAYFWYGWLDATILPLAPVSAQAIITKVVMDQLLYSPVMTSLFFSGMAVCDGKGVSGALTMIRQKLWPTLLATWVLWPAAHVINFMYVPTDLRILYINIVAIVWTAYLSTVAAAPTTAPPPKEVSMGASTTQAPAEEPILATAPVEQDRLEPK